MPLIRSPSKGEFAFQIFNISAFGMEDFTMELKPLESTIGGEKELKDWVIKCKQNGFRSLVGSVRF